MVTANTVRFTPLKMSVTELTEEKETKLANLIATASTGIKYSLIDRCLRCLFFGK